MALLVTTRISQPYSPAKVTGICHQPVAYQRPKRLPRALQLTQQLLRLKLLETILPLLLRRLTPPWIVAQSTQIPVVENQGQLLSKQRRLLRMVKRLQPTQTVLQALPKDLYQVTPQLLTSKLISWIPSAISPTWRR